MDDREYKRLLSLLDEALNIRTHELQSSEYAFLRETIDRGVWTLNDEDKRRLEGLAQRWRERSGNDSAP